MSWKKCVGYLFAGCTVLLIACNKSAFTNSTNAYLYTSLGDTLDFGTVFTSQMSPTQSFKIFNGNKQSIRINELKLFGGATSAFKINVNGVSGTNFPNIDLAAGDSMYVFVSVNIPQSSPIWVNPFFVRDSIGYSYNGKTQFIQLRATAQNAFFLKEMTITRDTTWMTGLPIVVLGNITVAPGVTLSIDPGAHIFFQAKSGLKINGRLNAVGGADSLKRILLTNNRTDWPYSEMPGSWNGIRFGANSFGNSLQNVDIQNAYTGIADTSNPGNTNISRLTLNGCRITNAYNQAILLNHSNVQAYNCLISNSGTEIELDNGGQYYFEYCTVAGYSNNFVSHTNPSLMIDGQAENGNSSTLQASFVNCIIYGDDDYLDEIALSPVANTAFNIVFRNVLYKAKNTISGATFTDCIRNVDPMFSLLDFYRLEYDFRVTSGSPAIGNALPATTLIDLLGRPRSTRHPTIGCYEFDE